MDDSIPQGNALFGPMTEPEFRKKVRKLPLPAFSKTLAALE